MDIRCRKLDCEFNDRFTCRAKSLLVNKKGNCSVYKKTDRPVCDTTKNLFSSVPEYSPQRDVKRFVIECCASCVLNKEGRCVANGITLNDYKENPVCMTIVKK